MITTIFMIVFLSACKSNDNEYDEIIDQVFEEVQKFNDDDNYLYIHGGREESSIYIYELEGHEDEGLIIRVFYPYEEKKTGKKGQDEDWYIYDSSTKDVKDYEISLNIENQLIKKTQEIKLKIK